MLGQHPSTTDGGGAAARSGPVPWLFPQFLKDGFDGFCKFPPCNVDQSDDLTGGPLPASLVPSNTSTKTALKPVKLFEGICEGGCEIGSRFAVQTLCLD
jgi:hypothetical protein